MGIMKDTLRPFVGGVCPARQLRPAHLNRCLRAICEAATVELAACAPAEELLYANAETWRLGCAIASAKSKPTAFAVTLILPSWLFRRIWHVGAMRVCTLLNRCYVSSMLYANAPALTDWQFKPHLGHSRGFGKGPSTDALFRAGQLHGQHLTPNLTTGKRLYPA